MVQSSLVTQIKTDWSSSLHLEIQDSCEQSHFGDPLTHPSYLVCKTEFTIYLGLNFLYDKYVLLFYFIFPRVAKVCISTCFSSHLFTTQTHVLITVLLSQQ